MTASLGGRQLGLVRGWAAAGLVAVAVGCAPSPTPRFLTLDAARYPDAFDAAVEAARIVGMPPALRDRRGGVIETDPSIAASILEPWRSGQETLGQALENTLTFQRRRARFEFTAAGAGADPPSGREPPAPLTGPDLFGTRTQPVDFTDYSGTLELRVWVYLERAHTPGLRRSTWTRSKTTRTTSVSPQPRRIDDPVEPTTFWEPIARDTAFEGRLLSAVSRRLRVRSAADMKSRP